MDCLYKFKNPAWMIGKTPLKLNATVEKNEAKTDIKQKLKQVVEKAATVAARATSVSPLFVEGKQSMFVVAAPPSADKGISTSGPLDHKLVETFGGGTLRRCSSLASNLNTLVEEEEAGFLQDLTFFKGEKVDEFYDDDDDFDDEDEGIAEFDESRFPFQYFTPMETIFEVEEEGTTEE